MSETRCGLLAEKYGDAGIARLASAYETALLTITFGDLATMPDRRTRAAMIAAILAEADRCSLNADSLVVAALRGAAE